MTDPMPNGAQSKKKTHNLIIGILAIIVVILLFSWLNEESEEMSNDISDNEEVVNDDTADEKPEVTGSNFDGISPSDWELTERAETGISSLTSGQQIDFYVMPDPSDENVVYFAASAYDEGDDQQMIGIYKYNTDDYNFERIFRRSYDAGDIEGLPEEARPVIRVVGVDDGRLVLLVQSNDDSPGPCSQPLLLADSDGRLMWSMSVSDPYGGFEEYVLDEEVRADAELAQATCEEAF
ncbi:hypothetical protein HON52_03670 [Candidatus Uhrbacteria bacterium]|jgi:hypothetical protein|nr:hypothetical protein [Candidatus Uhrbacteria bacterium]